MQHVIHVLIEYFKMVHKAFIPTLKGFYFPPVSFDISCIDCTMYIRILSYRVFFYWSALREIRTMPPPVLEFEAEPGSV